MTRTIVKLFWEEDKLFHKSDFIWQLNNAEKNPRVESKQIDETRSTSSRKSSSITVKIKNLKNAMIILASFIQKKSILFKWEI